MACLTSFLALFLLLTFCYLPFFRKSTHPKLWWSSVPFPVRMKEVGFALVTWILAMPLVGFIEQTFDLILYILFGVEHYDQVAVLYLKKAAHSLRDLSAALLLILWIAPIAEETLFRGFLQSWLKKHLGNKAAILLASLCFALFHFSPSHGIGNLSLIPTLFTFSCFLGFVYEKKNSLFASAFLHGFFNFINAARILFFESH
jgi:membrane protease YdiL (CAAX protease family)